jgi:hypothetical protein
VHVSEPSVSRLNSSALYTSRGTQPSTLSSSFDNSPTNYFASYQVKLSANPSSSTAPSDAPEHLNEILQYHNYREIAPCEASWRMLGFPVHSQYPPTVRLELDLQGQERVVLHKGIAPSLALANRPPTRLEGFFNLCKNPGDTLARTLLYVEVPQHYTWIQKAPRHWQRRAGKTLAVGRLRNVLPSARHLTCLLLLNLRSAFPCCKTNDIVYKCGFKSCTTLHTHSSLITLRSHSLTFYTFFQAKEKSTSCACFCAMFVAQPAMRTFEPLKAPSVPPTVTPA